MESLLQKLKDMERNTENKEVMIRR